METGLRRARRRVPALLLATATAWIMALGFPTPVRAGGSGARAAETQGVTPTTTPLLQVTVPPLPPVSLPLLTLPPVTVPPIVVPPLSVADLAVLPPPGAQPAPAGVSPGPTAVAPDGASAPADAAPPPVAPDAPAGAPATNATHRSRAVPPGAPPPAAEEAAAVTGPLPLRLRNAASETARRLSFPLGLAVAIVAFLILQPRLDRGDPSVAHPGVSREDDLLGFS